MQPLILKDTEDDRGGEAVNGKGEEIERGVAAVALQHQLQQEKHHAVKDKGNDRINGGAFWQFAQNAERHGLVLKAIAQALRAVEHLADKDGDDDPNNPPVQPANASHARLAQQAQGDENGGKQTAVEQIAGAQEIQQAAV